MGEIVNLRRARKDRKRDAANAEASHKRAAFGRPRIEKQANAARQEIEARRLDGHRLTGPSDAAGPGNASPEDA